MRNMKQGRYTDLMAGLATLTDAERRDGWHFCCEWDGLLIHPTHPEFEACDCTLELDLDRLVRYAMERGYDKGVAS